MKVPHKLIDVREPATQKAARFISAQRARPKSHFRFGGLVNKGHETMYGTSVSRVSGEAGVVPLMIPEYTAHNVIACMHTHVLV